MNLKSLIPLVPAGIILASMFVSHSCANTTTAPTGGPKDTIPPVLVAVYPLPGQMNIPQHRTEIVFKFNEFVQVKDQKSISFSPPLEKPFKTRISGKSVIVYFDEDLLPNTTYTIDITGAIVDVNENNPFPGYALTFSTGEKIDSMYVTGLVQDCVTLKPAKGATVMLYKDQADSAVYLHRPDAAIKADDWGFFCLRNIQDTVFRMYAIIDENGNNMYDPETEKIAFLDSAVTPRNRVAKDIYELYKFDMLDTLSCLKRKTEYELNLFKGNPGKQMIVNKVRVDERTSYITFMSPDPQIRKLYFKGVKAKDVIAQFNPEKDSLVFWINERRAQPDTLKLTVDYMKTDSTGKLTRFKEKIKLVRPKENKLPAKSYRKDIKHEDTIAVYKMDYKAETFEQNGISISFNYPLIEEAFDSLKYEVTNVRQKREKGKYSVERDTNDIRTVRIRHIGKILPGYEYKLTVPERRFRDINGYYNDSTVVSIKLPDDDKLSTLTLNVTGVEKGGPQYIIDLMDEKRANILRRYTINTDATLLFPYLKDGNYCIRVACDANRNNIVDTGDLLKHLQPEIVRFYKLKDNDFLLAIPSSSEISQDINIKEMFK